MPASPAVGRDSQATISSCPGVYLQGKEFPEPGRAADLGLVWSLGPVAALGHTLGGVRLMHPQAVIVACDGHWQGEEQLRAWRRDPDDGRRRILCYHGSNRRGYLCPGPGRPRGSGGVLTCWFRGQLLGWLCVMGAGAAKERPDLLNRNGRSRLRFTLAAPESGARFARPERHRRSADPQVFMPVGVLVRDADWP
jgi:hypothetical protein